MHMEVPTRSPRCKDLKRRFHRQQLLCLLLKYVRRLPIISLYFRLPKNADSVISTMSYRCCILPYIEYWRFPAISELLRQEQALSNMMIRHYFRVDGHNAIISR